MGAPFGPRSSNCRRTNPTEACGLGGHDFALASFRANILGNEVGRHPFLVGYHTQRILADADHAAIPIFVALRQYVLMGLRATFVAANSRTSWWLHKKAPIAFFSLTLTTVRRLRDVALSPNIGEGAHPARIDRTAFSARHRRLPLLQA